MVLKVEVGEAKAKAKQKNGTGRGQCRHRADVPVRGPQNRKETLWCATTFWPGADNKPKRKRTGLPGFAPEEIGSSEGGAGDAGFPQARSSTRKRNEEENRNRRRRAEDGRPGLI